MNDMHDICTKISANSIVWSCLFFLGFPKSNAHALRFTLVSGRRALFSYRAGHEIIEFSSYGTEERSEAEFFCAV